MRWDVGLIVIRVFGGIIGMMSLTLVLHGMHPWRVLLCLAFATWLAYTDLRGSLIGYFDERPKRYDPYQ